jgi:hypothetical protein
MPLFLLDARLKGGSLGGSRAWSDLWSSCSDSLRSDSSDSGLSCAGGGWLLFVEDGDGDGEGSLRESSEVVSLGMSRGQGVRTV